MDCLNLNPNNADFTYLSNGVLSHKIDARDHVFRPNNLPTMTLEEFARKETERMKEAERKQEEAKLNAPNEDSDTEEGADNKTYKDRYWDDWKDLHEKGAGNKKK